MLDISVNVKRVDVYLSVTVTRFKKKNTSNYNCKISLIKPKMNLFYNGTSKVLI